MIMNDPIIDIIHKEKKPGRFAVPDPGIKDYQYAYVYP